MKTFVPVVALLTLRLSAPVLYGVDPLPHSTREGRLVDIIDGWEIEYSPEHDGYVKPLANALTEWRQQQLSNDTATPDVPLSPQDMREQRDDILLQIAREIGLEQPTSLQGPCYDTFLNYYEMVLALHQSLAQLQEHLSSIRRFALWDRAELAARLERGEAVEGFTRNAATGEIDYNFKVSTSGSHEPSGEQRALQTVAADGLDHGFNYTVKDGVANFSASVKIQLGKLAKSPAPIQASRAAEQVRAELQKLDFVVPVKLTDEHGKLIDPEHVAEQHIRFMQHFAEGAARAPSRDGALVLLLLHETVEVGLVEHYIGSRDRRWLCDGTANYLAWKIARDRAGVEFARQVYDLDAQLARVASLQPKIQLARWPAVERQTEKDRKSELDGAHYAFASRALFLMAEQHGEDIVPRLWQEIGRTPRGKASAKTADRAFRKLTGARLRPLISAAEESPLPAAAASR
jgi:hypothetical protein